MFGKLLQIAVARVVHLCDGSKLHLVRFTRIRSRDSSCWCSVLVPVGDVPLQPFTEVHLCNLRLVACVLTCEEALCKVLFVLRWLTLQQGHTGANSSRDASQVSSIIPVEFHEPFDVFSGRPTCPFFGCRLFELRDLRFQIHLQPLSEVQLCSLTLILRVVASKKTLPELISVLRLQPFTLQLLQAQLVLLRNLDEVTIVVCEDRRHQQDF
mmetsp:Transcript_13109/g.33033  ORF Transcript_13109/g.33033 Transcript_13109/m.33033 type:complete len:211 (-) Transcript_13109:532-1164(-)